MLVSFGEQVGIGTTLTAALDDVLGIASRTDDVTPGSGGDTGGTGGTGGTGLRETCAQLLRQAEAKFATAQKALQSGDLQGYAKAQAEARDLVQQALAAAGEGDAQRVAVAELVGRPSASPSNCLGRVDAGRGWSSCRRPILSPRPVVP